jgi:hypothetical protein
MNVSLATVSVNDGLATKELPPGNVCLPWCDDEYSSADDSDYESDRDFVMEDGSATFHHSDAVVDVAATEEEPRTHMFRLFTEPPHTSNFLQAVDVIAKQIHVAYDKRKKRFLIEKHGKDKWRSGDLTQGDFLAIVLSIWPHWSSKEERQNAFRKVQSYRIMLATIFECNSFILVSFNSLGWYYCRWTQSRLPEQATGSIHIVYCYIACLYSVCVSFVFIVAMGPTP